MRAVSGSPARPRTGRLVTTGVLLASLTLPAFAPAAPPPGRLVQLERKVEKAHRLIKRQHLPYGTIFDPRFEAADSSRIAGYTHAGDSAIWTGHYLAAESLRYAATGSSKARSQVKRTLRALAMLIDVTGSEVLARATAPIGSPLEAAIREGNPDQLYGGALNGVPHLWHGGTSRDQYSGVFFGLSFAWELIPANKLRNRAAALVTRLLEYLLANSWTVTMPDGRVSTTFLQRPDQQLAFLQIGRQVNPERFASTYASYRDRLGALVRIPIALETTDPHGSYFKFNLDAINLLHLIRLEDSATYRAHYLDAWRILYNTVGAHDNAHFDAIDALIRGSDSKRDPGIESLLTQWLKRPARDEWVDLRGRYEACEENRACEPVPVVDRPTTDFLWQRSPFTLYGGGAGLVEAPGLDLILPFWLARYAGAL